MRRQQYIEIFKNKSDADLERIALNATLFVDDIRSAAIYVLKERNYDLTTIYIAEKNLQKFELSREIQDQRVIWHFLQLPIKQKRIFDLANGNELVVKRLSKNCFQVRIEHSKSAIAPILISKIKNSTTLVSYPFFYLKSILIFGVCLPTLGIILSFFDIFEIDRFPLLLLPIVVIGVQILMMPFIYFGTLECLRERLG